MNDFQFQIKLVFEIKEHTTLDSPFIHIVFLPSIIFIVTGYIADSQQTSVHFIIIVVIIFNSYSLISVELSECAFNGNLISM